ncbi:P-loop containing nucleoside triphosphate hydrolase protein [Hygrophoropsis aurantiaca]|uniref:P-loop containing nucleoside triphosphate hydrolase protein n=1 Tax=Hygrophoropsis aurantiaca TaxID=72124 RepID=A0ACB8AAQ7_9AGAM|nr:P-loop containing nucleoside triphosphate hydrolase protein [Hygrophoropsis aurantiaca]
MNDKTENDGVLESLLQKSHNKSPALPDELSYLVAAFVPSQPTASRSKAYLVLSAFCRGVRSSKVEEKATKKSDQPDQSVVEHQVLQAISFFSALFQVDWESASYIIQQDGIMESLGDVSDLFPAPLISLELARLFGHASSHKACRVHFSEDIKQWLTSKSRQQSDPALQVASSIALFKLSQGAATDAADGSSQSSEDPRVDENLAQRLKDMVINLEDNGSTTNEVIEGLAYLSVDANIKETLAKDLVFLKKLFGLAPDPKGVPQSPINSSLLYGILVIISNICAYKPRLSHEESQLAKLKQMTKSNTRSAQAGTSNPFDDDYHVKARVHLLVSNGALNVLAVASGVHSQGIRSVTGKIYLDIVEDKENRGKVLQSGGAKHLARIINPISSTTTTTTSSSSRAIGTAELPAIQALAKLAITASPVQVFGPNEGAMYDAINPLVQMLLCDSSNLLQQFEALMALTNISSQSASCATRVATTANLLNKVELLVLEDHLMIRRAATELVCNLIAGSDDVFMRFSGAGIVQTAKSKLQVLLAMSDIDDLPTRLAASGALAIITNAQAACQALLELQMERHRVFPILTQLIDPGFDQTGESIPKDVVETKQDPGLTHRGIAISKKAGKKSTPSKAGPAKVAKADWKEGFKKKQVGVSDMTLLTTISNDSINDNLQKRWTNAEIYTYIGGVLISVNPFRDLGIYTDEILHRYKGKNRLEVPPHVFSIAETAYYNMNAYHENQCVIISGESGAGKTEAAKRIMQYIAAVSGGQDNSIQEIKDMVLATNPLLESFGCAKTLRNNNSSRHGKYLEIMFNTHGEPVGAQITNYLLEKGRVVGQIENERNFHIFYQFTKAASPEQREQFGLQGPESYAYTSMSNCLEVQDVDDDRDFAETIEQSEIFRMLAIILWLGNVQFEEMDDGNATIADTSVTDFISYLMEVDPAAVQKALTSRTMETQRGGRRGSIYDVPLNPAQATAGRDALAKAIYNNLFEWIVSRINVSMKPRGTTSQVIGILDIFGFEIFEDNSFEQLCINYVNEKLQQIFIELTLKTEQEEYVREQIQWTPIKYFNNKIVCDLIEERKPPGIFAALNDACATAHADPAAADNSFVQRTAMLSSNPHFEARGAQFLVRHYAGDVMYNIAGMTDKNKDALIKDLLDLIASSSNDFLQTIFPDRPDPSSKKRPPTAGDRIKASAGALVDNLMKAQPSYIRTIKPNQNRSGSEYDSKAILHQIKYLGLQENIRVRRAGFAYRNTFEKMVERFYLLSPSTSYAGEYTWSGDAKSGCQQILKDTGIAKDEWQMGVTKAFIKNPETLFALETMRDRYWHNMASRIQRAWRNYWRYKNECARRIQRFWKNNKEGIEYAKVREYGHQILAGRKERRRFSLLSYRRFMGDYLGVNAKSAEGNELRSACGLGAEQVSFSCKIQLLVAKFGRSSKPSPRFLVLTTKAVHIVILSNKDGVTQTSLERKIPLITIKNICMSTLRDDWTLTQGSINLIINPTVEYSKKKDKKAEIKFVKDETVTKDDVYKSHTVHVPSGEPPNSTSRSPAKRKPGIVRPITEGKLLRAGGPSAASKARSKPVAQAQVKPKPASVTTKPTVLPTTSKAPPMPPARTQDPPIPAAEPEEPDAETYKAKFAFEGQEGEMTFKKDDILELVEKDDNGWWLVKMGGREGWAPNNYLELVPQKPKALAPPPPPARRPPQSAPPNPKPTPVAAPAKSVIADASAKPIAVFPGAAHSNGSATPWKKSALSPPPDSSSSSPASSRPSSAMAGKAAPSVPAKPKVVPPIAAKPGAAKPGKPPIPTAPRPVSVAAAPKSLPAKSGPPAGQLDLAAALAKRAQKIAEN